MSERRADTPKEVVLAGIRKIYDAGEGLTLKQIAQYAQLSAELAIDDANRSFGTAVKDFGTTLTKSSNEAAKKVSLLLPDLSREQKRMLVRLTDLQAQHLSSPDDFSLEELAELKMLEMALATSDSVSKFVNSSTNRLFEFVENLLPSGRMKKLSPVLSLTTLGGMLIAACTGGSAFGAPRLTDTAGSPKTSTPMPTITPTRTERPATATPIELVDPTETAFPTETATNTETPTKEAMNVTVDEEGFMGDGNFHFRVDPDLYKGTETKVYDGADRIFYGTLYRKLASNPRFNNIDWFKALDSKAPWEGQWGEVEVVMPLSLVGSGYVEDVKSVVLDLSKPIYFDLTPRVTLDQLQSTDASVNPNVGDFFATGTIDGNSDVFVGFGLRVDEVDGSIHVTYAEKGSTKMQSFTADKRDRYTTGYVAYPLFWFEKLLLGLKPLEAKSATQGIWNSFGDGRSYGLSYTQDGQLLYDVIAVSVD